MTRNAQTTRKQLPVGDIEVLAQWAFTRVGSILVLCTRGAREPPETDVDAWLVRAARSDYAKILLHAGGGHPDAKQRARVAAFWGKSSRPIPPVAILSDSTLARSVLTALSWISSIPMHAFAGDDIAGALKYLDEDPSALEPLKQTLELLDRALVPR